jgi:hypothetical protein
MVGKLWVDGVGARRAGVSYRCPPLVHFGRMTELVLRTLIEQEIETFAPSVVVYLTAESVMGRAMTKAAQEKGVPAVGLQTFFQRDAVLVHMAGANWWKELRDIPLSDTVEAGIESESGAPGIPFFGQPVSSLPPNHRPRAWTGRAERAIRSALGSGYQRPTEGLSRL